MMNSADGAAEAVEEDGDGMGDFLGGLAEAEPSIVTTLQDLCTEPWNGFVLTSKSADVTAHPADSHMP